MQFNGYNYEISYEQFHRIYLQGDIKLLLVTVNNRLKFEIEIAHDLPCHTIFNTYIQQRCFNSNVIIKNAVERSINAVVNIVHVHRISYFSFFIIYTVTAHFNRSAWSRNNILY